MGESDRSPPDTSKALGLIVVQRRAGPHTLRVAGWSVAVVLALALTGCSSGHPTAGATTTSTRATTSTTVADPNASAALKVWRDYVDVSQQWLNPPNAADARIATYIASSAVADFRANVGVQQAKGLGERPGPSGNPHHDITVVSASAADVVIRDCFVDDSVSYNVKSGAVVDDAVVTRTLEVRLVPESGTWKIARVDERSKRQGRVPCA